MKIAQISTQIYSVPPRKYGGLELVVWDLSKALADMGHEVLIIGPEGTKTPPNGKAHIGGPERTDLTEQQDIEIYQGYKDILKDYDIICDHSWSKRAINYKVEHPNANVCFVHHGMSPYSRKPPINDLNWICISQSHAFAFSESWGIDCPYVHNGIDIDKYKFKEEKSDRFLFLSRIYPPKGAHVAIDLANEMKFNLDVVGGSFGDDPLYIEHIKRECEKSAYAVFHGEVSHEEKVDFLSNAKALISPLITYADRGRGIELWWEPCGLHIIEALASGTPVITTYNGGAKELVDDDSLVGALCHGLEDLRWAIQNINGIAHPFACRERAETLFSREAMAEKYLSLYRRILDGECISPAIGVP